ncbi:class I SAM-dependent methyltransferase [Ktedonosporobacter rubrisoli]|uniref:Class I SAM-dependent methyltransferase n=1 Tax=Ktedonosporobacter rubrisoli TaxID=2509675 RepID=A0A4P6JM52_KTERU|nr:class I SAM-dependent methyltransferase [Ktedonosporobacter rubrisoli]QBD76082.1 class I SAM-dependent methyltransferase [Ktedonosporobacter rubrisoli]
MSRKRYVGNSYLLDQESVMEMGRLIDLDVLVTKHMGGHFPPDIDLTKIHDILDIACGPGGWASEVAFAYPDKHIVGIDISQAMLEYAVAQARVQQLPNVEFRYMNAVSSLQFPNASFDLVNARFMISFMWKEAWPDTIKECMRVLRPGGIVRITDTDQICSSSSSVALEEMSAIIARAFFCTGRSLNEHEQCTHPGLISRLYGFLQRAGCAKIREQAHILNYSTGCPAHLRFARNLEIVLLALQPFLREAGVATQQQLDELYQQVLIDLRKDDFYGIMYFMSVYGEKAAEL